MWITNTFKKTISDIDYTPFTPKLIIIMSLMVLIYADRTFFLLTSFWFTLEGLSQEGCDGCFSSWS